MVFCFHISCMVLNIQDKYKRALAETENVRQRFQKQIQDAKLFGIQGFCKDMLEVADILNKAAESVSQEELRKADAALKTLYEGLQMTEVQLHKVFTRHGLVRLSPAEGEKFDPNCHEAQFVQPLAEGKTPGTVFIVNKVGYKLHERTLRPALVGVFASKQASEQISNVHFQCFYVYFNGNFSTVLKL